MAEESERIKAMTTQERLANVQSMVENIQHMRELGEKRDKTLAEMEYAVLVSETYKAHGGEVPDGYNVVPTFRFTSRDRGEFGITLRCKEFRLKDDDAEAKTMWFKVRTHHGTNMMQLNTPADIWQEHGENEVPDRLFELFIKWNNKKVAPSYFDKIRERRLALGKPKERRYG